MSLLEPSKKRLVHLYTGDGKGKSTAAVGLCLRALGHGWKVLYCRFLKARPSRELALLERVGAEIVSAPASVKFTWDLTEDEKEALAHAHLFFLTELKDKMSGFDLMVMDEVVDAVNLGFVPIGILEKLVKSRPEMLELVLTGHNPSKEICCLAHYHTDFRCVRHPYQQGVAARNGIEI